MCISGSSSSGSWLEHTTLGGVCCSWCTASDCVKVVLVVVVVVVLVLLVVVMLVVVLLVLVAVLVVRVAEVARGHGGPPPKSLDSDENFQPKHTLFCHKLRFVTIYALFFEIFGQKKCLFG